jgi:hypothetical protein
VIWGSPDRFSAATANGRTPVVESISIDFNGLRRHFRVVFLLFTAEARSHYPSTQLAGKPFRLWPLPKLHPATSP